MRKSADILAKLKQKIISALRGFYQKIPYILLGGLIVLYCWHWLSLTENVEPVESTLVAVEHETDEEAIAGFMEEEPYMPNKLPADFAVYLQTSPDIQDVPDIEQVLHISRLLQLEKPVAPQKAPVAHSTSSQPRIAIVIDDMGASPKRTESILAVKAPIATSFLTFAPQLQRQVKQSRAAGHEVMIHVPMQPKSNIYVSEDVLTVDMTEAQIYESFQKMLAKFDGIKGINNHMGSRFTEHGEKLAPVMKLLAENGLFFLDSKTTAHSKGAQTADTYGVPHIARDVFLDNEDNFEYILQQLEKTEKIARKTGYAVAIGHPKKHTARALQAWLETLNDKGIVLVHLSQLVPPASKN